MVRRSKVLWGGSRWLVVLLVLVGCVALYALKSALGGPIHRESVIEKLSLNTPELMCKAILVMDASVSSVGPGHWNTPDGSKPAGADASWFGTGGYAVYTPLSLSSMHVYIDHRSQPTTEFDTVGGKAGPDSDDEGSYPSVTAQYRYLFTMVDGFQVGKGDVPTVLIANDAFPIDDQGMVTLEPAHTEFGPGGKNQTENFPAVTMPLTQIVQQLAACPTS